MQTLSKGFQTLLHGWRITSISVAPHSSFSSALFCAPSSKKSRKICLFHSMIRCFPKLEIREAIYHMCKNALASNKMFEAIIKALSPSRIGACYLSPQSLRQNDFKRLILQKQRSGVYIAKLPIKMLGGFV